MIYFKGTIADAKNFGFRKINHKEEQSWRSYCYMTTCPAPLTTEQRADKEYIKDYCQRESSFLTIYDDGRLKIDLSGGNLESYGERLFVELWEKGFIEFISTDESCEYENNLASMRKRK